MAALAELDAAPDTIEAELIYLAKPEKLVTYVAKPGGVDEREGGESVTHRVRIHNGRPLADRFEFEREGFRFVPHHSRVADFLNDDEVRRVYYPECEALIKQVSGAKRVVVFDHTLRTASERRSAKRRKSATSSAGFITTTPNGPGRSGCATSWGRGRDAAPGPLRNHPGVAADQPPGRKPSAGDLRRADRQARERSSSTSGAIPTGSARPMRSPTTRSSAGTGSRACGPTRRWCSRSTSCCATAAPAGPRTPPSRTPPPRRTPVRAKASKSARWRFSDPSGPRSLSHSRFPLAHRGRGASRPALVIQRRRCRLSLAPAARSTSDAPRWGRHRCGTGGPPGTGGRRSCRR